MVLVDTSVWIDFLKGKSTEQVNSLLHSIESEETIAFTGVILQELFQGINDPEQRKEIEADFSPFIELFPQRSTYLKAASLFRDSRSNGHLIRSSIDCFISACCIENNCQLLHKDRDFEFIAEISDLKLY